MKEVTYAEWQKNPTPRMMWVWGYDEDYKVQRKVIYVLKADAYVNPVLAVADESIYESYKHCAEIEKTRRMTNKELSRWLRENPTREYKCTSNSIANDSLIYCYYTYPEICADNEVNDNILIREGDSDWQEPLVEVEE